MVATSGGSGGQRVTRSTRRAPGSSNSGIRSSSGNSHSLSMGIHSGGRNSGNGSNSTSNEMQPAVTHHRTGMSIVFSLSNDPCLKYDFTSISDRSYVPKSWTSYRLKQFVLYLEDDANRYELSCEGRPITADPDWLVRIRESKQNPSRNSSNGKSDDSKSSNLMDIDSNGTSAAAAAAAAAAASSSGSWSNSLPFDTYRFSRVRRPKLLDREAMSRIPIPLEDSHIDVIEAQLQWPEIEWGNESVVVRNRCYKIRRMFYVKRSHWPVEELK